MVLTIDGIGAFDLVSRESIFRVFRECWEVTGCSRSSDNSAGRFFQIHLQDVLVSSTTSLRARRGTRVFVDEVEDFFLATTVRPRLPDEDKDLGLPIRLWLPLASPLRVLAGVAVLSLATDEVWRRGGRWSDSFPFPTALPPSPTSGRGWGGLGFAQDCPSEAQTPICGCFV